MFCFINEVIGEGISLYVTNKNNNYADLKKIQTHFNRGLLVVIVCGLMVLVLVCWFDSTLALLHKHGLHFNCIVKRCIRIKSFSGAVSKLQFESGHCCW